MTSNLAIFKFRVPQRNTVVAKLLLLKLELELPKVLRHIFYHCIPLSQKKWYISYTHIWVRLDIILKTVSTNFEHQIIKKNLSYRIAMFAIIEFSLQIFNQVNFLLNFKKLCWCDMCVAIYQPSKSVICLNAFCAKTLVREFESCLVSLCTLLNKVHPLWSRTTVVY